MLNKDFIIRKIKLIQEELVHLKKFSEYTFDEIVKDYQKLAMIERFLEKTIIRAIDINQHIISELGDGTEEVRGYEDTFLILPKLGVYSEDFAKKISPSAGLRNRLVHEYDKLDYEIVYKSVGEVLKDYAKYCKDVLQFIETR